jgi:hypothetical protein
MTIKKETVDKVIELTKQGFTQKDIAEQTGVQERTQRHWKMRGYPGVGILSSPVTELEKGKHTGEPAKISAADLVKAGFIPEKVHIILSAQDLAIEQGNLRLIDFLNSYAEIGRQWDNVPPVWRALMAGFPIIGQDIGSQSLLNLAQLVREFHPYLSKELRRTYHKRAKPILMGILAELQAFLQDAAMAGGLPLIVSGGPPPDWKDWLPWNTFAPKSWKVDESLVKGAWGYMIPAKVYEMKIDIKRTWAGFLYDIVSRLPDPDKQKGKLLKNYDLMSLVYIWCSTAPRDFKPPLPDIARRPVSSDDHTFAGVYKGMVEYSEASKE